MANLVEFIVKIKDLASGPMVKIAGQVTSLSAS